MLTGKGFIHYNKKEDGDKAIAASGVNFNGSSLEIKLASDPKHNDKGKQGGSPQKQGSGNTVFVGNLSFQSTKESVEQCFKGCGAVNEVRIAMGNDGRPRGFAHVEFADAESVEKALKLNGQDLDGRNIKVDVAGNKGGDGNRGGRSDRGGRFGGRSRSRGGFRGGRGGFRGRRGGY